MIASLFPSFIDECCHPHHELQKIPERLFEVSGIGFCLIIQFDVNQLDMLFTAFPNSDSFNSPLSAKANANL